MPSKTPIKPIHSDQDYEATLKQIEGLMDAEAGTPEAEELIMLVTQVEHYEAQHFPMD